MTNFIRTRIARTLTAGLLAVVLAASLAPMLQAGSAEATSAPGVPGHYSGAVSCGSGTFRSYPPNMASVSGAIETVYWKPVLFEYTTSGWREVTGASQMKNWAWATANATGTLYFPYIGGTWFDMPSNMGVLFRNFTGLKSNTYYAVKNFYYWLNGTQHQDFSTYCKVQ